MRSPLLQAKPQSLRFSPLTNPGRYVVWIWHPVDPWVDRVLLFLGGRGGGEGGGGGGVGGFRSTAACNHGPLYSGGVCHGPLTFLASILS